MKVFIAILAIVAVVHGEWNPKTGEEIRAIRAECLKEHPLSDATLSQLKQFVYPDEESLRQYLLCNVVKFDVFCTHEGYHADRLVKQFNTNLDAAEALTIIEGCIDKNEQGSSSDVWAFRGHKCLMASKVGDGIKAYVQKKLHEAAQKSA